ncbi:hypothetical protein C5167_050846 [Papaver somniferum]|uniref:Uncharacterized protein n=1 Tax=Papaver somniferum TaxID=3469 RepID=A0A4Y7KSM6_PAPSO|nr:hypothetical protein C5167_050846 [Papaver somniferum]
MANPEISLLVFSGGTEINGVVEDMKKLTTRLLGHRYILIENTRNQNGWNHNTWATTKIASNGSIQPVDKKGSSIPALASRTKRMFYMSSEGRNLLHEVFLLNGSHDRETSDLSASGFITGIADALNRTYRDPQNCMKNPQVSMLLPCWFPRMVKFQ